MLFENESQLTKPNICNKIWKIVIMPIEEKNTFVTSKLVHPTMPTPLYLWRKVFEGRLFVWFCLLCWDLPNHGAPNHSASCCSFGIVGETYLLSRGALSWFQDVIEYLTNFSLEINLNKKYIYVREFGHILDNVKKTLNK